MKRLILLTTFICVFISLCKVSAQEKITPENIIVNPQHTLSAKDTAMRKAVLKWSREMLRSGRYKDVAVQPSADFFPGAVKQGFTFVNKKIHLSHQKIADSLIPIVAHLGYSGAWNNNLYSTGLYAKAGEPIEIAVPKELLNKHISIQIGIHSDNLGQWVAGKEDWRRMPMIVKREKLDDTKTSVTSPFGGLIYLSVSPKQDSFDGVVEIKNAISAPLYILGETSLPDWDKQLTENKAPWGELMSKGIIITLPDSVLQKVKHPDSVMRLWNLIVGAEMDLAQIDTPFYRPQRMVVDEQIGGGFMHSGYPIMVHHSPTKHLLSEDIIANPEKLLIPTKGGANWGFFHEIGHNMQNLDWVFGGTTEVSNNLFSLYCFDRLMGGQDDAHGGVSSKTTQQKMKQYFADGVSYEKWKSDPFLGLILFRQLQEGFGWEAFKTFFKQYHSLAAKFPNNDYAKTDQQKRDLWVVNFSKIVSRNLAPFFEKWGIPISEEAKAKVAPFAVWMPYNFPPQD